MSRRDKRDNMQVEAAHTLAMIATSSSALPVSDSEAKLDSDQKLLSHDVAPGEQILMESNVLRINTGSSHARCALCFHQFQRGDADVHVRQRASVLLTASSRIIILPDCHVCASHIDEFGCVRADQVGSLDELNVPLRKVTKQGKPTAGRPPAPRALLRRSASLDDIDNVLPPLLDYVVFAHKEALKLKAEVESLSSILRAKQPQFVEQLMTNDDALRVWTGAPTRALFEQLVRDCRSYELAHRPPLPFHTFGQLRLHGAADFDSGPNASPTRMYYRDVLCALVHLRSGLVSLVFA